MRPWIEGISLEKETEGGKQKETFSAGESSWLPFSFLVRFEGDGEKRRFELGL
jgi:hypothetical protein